MEEFFNQIVQRFLDEIKEVGWWWLVFGAIGQFAFTGRFLFQWIISEKRGRSVVPVFFWYLSLLGASMLLVYFIRRGEAVGAVGQSVGWFVYIRNIMLIRKSRLEDAGEIA